MNRLGSFDKTVSTTAPAMCGGESRAVPNQPTRGQFLKSMGGVVGLAALGLLAGCRNSTVATEADASDQRENAVSLETKDRNETVYEAAVTVVATPIIDYLADLEAADPGITNSYDPNLEDLWLTTPSGLVQIITNTEFTEEAAADGIKPIKFFVTNGPVGKESGGRTVSARFWVPKAVLGDLANPSFSNIRNSLAQRDAELISLADENISPDLAYTMTEYTPGKGGEVLKFEGALAAGENKATFNDPESIDDATFEQDMKKLSSDVRGIIADAG